METYFVVRDTNHPKEDLERNWSAPVGGWAIGDFVDSNFQSADEAQSAWDKFFDGEGSKEIFRYHPAHGSFVAVHYEGLGAWLLDAETLEEAIEEAATYADDLACTSESGNGHFYANQVVSYHEVREGKWIFELKSIY